MHAVEERLASTIEVLSPPQWVLASSAYAKQAQPSHFKRELRIREPLSNRNPCRNGSETQAAGVGELV